MIKIFIKGFSILSFDTVVKISFDLNVASENKKSHVFIVVLTNTRPAMLSDTRRSVIMTYVVNMYWKITMTVIGHQSKKSVMLCACGEATIGKLWSRQNHCAISRCVIQTCASSS